MKPWAEHVLSDSRKSSYSDRVLILSGPSGSGKTKQVCSTIEYWARHVLTKTVHILCTTEAVFHFYNSLKTDRTLFLQVTGLDAFLASELPDLAIEVRPVTKRKRGSQSKSSRNAPVESSKNVPVKSIDESKKIVHGEPIKVDKGLAKKNVELANKPRDGKRTEDTAHGDTSVSKTVKSVSKPRGIYIIEGVEHMSVKQWEKWQRFLFAKSEINQTILTNGMAHVLLVAGGADPKSLMLPSEHVYRSSAFKLWLQVSTRLVLASKKLEPLDPWRAHCDERYTGARFNLSDLVELLPEKKETEDKGIIQLESGGAKLVQLWTDSCNAKEGTLIQAHWVRPCKWPDEQEWTPKTTSEPWKMTTDFKLQALEWVCVYHAMEAGTTIANTEPVWGRLVNTLTDQDTLVIEQVSTEKLWHVRKMAFLFRNQVYSRFPLLPANHMVPSMITRRLDSACAVQFSAKDDYVIRLLNEYYPSVWSYLTSSQVLLTDYTDTASTKEDDEEALANSFL